jgi:hypothetical protein
MRWLKRFPGSPDRGRPVIEEAARDEAASDDAARLYGSAEQAYLEALAGGADDERLEALSRQVHEAAKQWEVADLSVPELPGIQRYYDPPEVLATLWRDVAAAHQRRAR